MKLNKKKSTKIIGIKEKTKEWNDQNQSFRHYISESTNNNKKNEEQQQTSALPIVSQYCCRHHIARP